MEFTLLAAAAFAVTGLYAMLYWESRHGNADRCAGSLFETAVTSAVAGDLHRAHRRHDHRRGEPDHPPRRHHPRSRRGVDRRGNVGGVWGVLLAIATRADSDGRRDLGSGPGRPRRVARRMPGQRRLSRHRLRPAVGRCSGGQRDHSPPRRAVRGAAVCGGGDRHRSVEGLPVAGLRRSRPRPPSPLPAPSGSSPSRCSRRSAADPVWFYALGVVVGLAGVVWFWRRRRTETWKSASSAAEGARATSSSPPPQRRRRGRASAPTQRRPPATANERSPRQHKPPKPPPLRSGLRPDARASPTSSGEAKTHTPLPRIFVSPASAGETRCVGRRNAED